MSPDAPPLPLEPFRIKAVERLHLPTREEREKALARAGLNLFNLTSEEVFIDLLTDSGTSAMSDRQWAALMTGDESYAGSRNFVEFERTVQDLTGFPFVIPTHQGRAAEHLLMSALLHPGETVPNNMHFDTTQAHVLRQGARPLNLAIPEAYDPQVDHPFKGNMDVPRLEELLRSNRKNVPLVMMTLTNNTGGGQPASLENLRAISAVCRAQKVPFYLDMCRWAENAYFIREREHGQEGRSIREIGRECFGLADGATMSAKKDGLVNIGGFVATRDAALVPRLKETLITFEGFPTYGGLARRDLAAMAVGLLEATDLDYLEHRIGQVRYLASLLDAEGIPYVHPPGGHGLYLDAHRFLPHLSASELPGQSLVVEIYREGAVRTCEVGGVMFGSEKPAPGTPPPLELVRLAIPRRVYTASHLHYVAETLKAVWRRRASIGGLRIIEAPERLRHFLAKFGPSPKRVSTTGSTTITRGKARSRANM
ncbi:MAG: tryptophanase [Euryarchaeota archaeon]|nr:tryptophanase [Euryarchaeota archaeon]MDE1835244.1 tryptophanase [Euryarchaeota archaeon]MDE1881047.1 tryptophanase [Euryarchaeota archaeon]MDE2043540.1 tryptophanase [Thermoplasmata archaeon]